MDTPITAAGAAPACARTDDPAYNWIYRQLVIDPNDAVGAFAYVLYKREKIEFIEATRQRHQRNPTPELRAKKTWSQWVRDVLSNVGLNVLTILVVGAVVSAISHSAGSTPISKKWRTFRWLNHRSALRRGESGSGKYAAANNNGSRGSRCVVSPRAFLPAPASS